MHEQPKLTPKDEIPPAVQALCDRVHAVAKGIPALIFLPNAEHSRLYPLVVLRDGADDSAQQINAFIQGEKTAPPPKALRQKHDLTLEAIHAAADYLPAIVFLSAANRLHPVNLVPETVPEHLKPCYEAVQSAQKSVIGTAPLVVSSGACA